MSRWKLRVTLSMISQNTESRKTLCGEQILLDVCMLLGACVMCPSCSYVFINARYNSSNLESFLNRRSTWCNERIAAELGEIRQRWWDGKSDDVPVFGSLLCDHFVALTSALLTSWDEVVLAQTLSLSPWLIAITRSRSVSCYSRLLSADTDYDYRSTLTWT